MAKKKIEKLETENMTDLEKFCQEFGISLSGMEDMPELRTSNVIYENPWDLEDDNLYVAQRMKLTMSKTPDGKIHPLSKVSPTYKLVHHHEVVLQTLQKVQSDFPEFGIEKILLSFQNNGGKMAARFQSGKGIEIAENDIIFPQILVSNSADASKRFSMAMGALRRACTNGMIIPDTRFPEHVNVKKLHKENILDIDVILDSMAIVGANLMESIKVFEEYTKKAISKVEMENIMEGVLTKPQHEKILQLPIRGTNEGKTLEQLFDSGNGSTTVWNAYNSVTQFLTDNNTNDTVFVERNRKIADKFDELMGIAA